MKPGASTKHEMRRSAEYYAKLVFAGYRWRGYHTAQRRHFFQNPQDGRWIALDEDDWKDPDFLRYLAIRRYTVNDRTVGLYLKQRSTWLFPPS